MPPPKTIWIVIPTYDPVIGGEQTQVRHVAAGLIERGWDVRIITRRHYPGAPKGLARRATIAGTPVRRAWSRGGKLGGLSFIVSSLLVFLSEGRGAIYHAHDIGTAGWAAVLARTVLGGQVVVKLRTGREAYQDYVRGAWNGSQFNKLLRSADAVEVLNADVGEFLGKQIAGDLPLHRLPNGVDVDLHRPASIEERRASRVELGIAPDTAVFLFVGRLQALKGLDVLLRAWSAFRGGSDAQAQLIVVGDGPDRPEVDDASIRWEGFRDDVSRYLRAADVFLLPSRVEGLSMALIEAMATGLPVVCSAVGAARDLLDGEAGQRLFDSGDDRRLEALLSEAAGDIDSYRTGGARNRDYAVRHLGLGAKVDRLERMYESLLDTRA